VWLPSPGQVKQPARAHARLAVQGERAARGADRLLDRAHPDPAPRGVGDGLRGGEPVEEDELQSLLSGHRPGLLGGERASLERAGQQALWIDPSTVIVHLDLERVLQRAGPQREGPGGILAPAILGGLEPVIQRVAGEVRSQLVASAG
jgi:hypothetical protein